MTLSASNKLRDSQGNPQCQLKCTLEANFLWEDKISGNAAAMAWSKNMWAVSTSQGNLHVGVRAGVAHRSYIGNDQEF